MGSSPKPPKPDPLIGQAAKENAATSKEMAAIARENLEFSREQYANQMTEYERLRPLFESLANGQIASTDLANTITRQSFDDYNTTYRPVEQRVAADAMAAGSAGEQALAAGRAGVDVQRNLDTQRDITGRNLASMGVNPNSGKFLSVNRAGEIRGAAAKAGAETQARAAEKLRGDMMRSSVAAMGKGMPGTSLTGIQVGGNSAAQAAGIAGMPLNTSNAIGQNFMSGQAAGASMLGNGANVNAGAANIMNNLFGSQMQVYGARAGSNNAMMGALGNIGGMALGGWLSSDENIKTGKKPLKKGEARKAIDGMRVEKWKYKPGMGFDDAEHVGTYAQDFAEQTGMGDGKRINVIDAIGVNMAATKELSKEVKSLRKIVQERGVSA